MEMVEQAMTTPEPLNTGPVCGDLPNLLLDALPYAMLVGHAILFDAGGPWSSNLRRNSDVVI